MKTYRVQATPDKTFSSRLRTEEGAHQAIGPFDVRIAVKATSLNYRDLLVVRGEYAASQPPVITPCSDGAGEILEVGSAVTRFTVGDRVMASFFPNWADGRPTPAKFTDPLGGGATGMLTEEAVLPEKALVRIPNSMTYSEAATLPCAGVTAWNALFRAGNRTPGNRVLLLGTGGVSVWALQLAKAAGLQAFITSSDDTKLEKAQGLGAQGTINYQTTPDWDQAVLHLTKGEGVDTVLEVGGKDTLNRSVAATAMGGNIAVIGGVSGFDGQLSAFDLVRTNKTLSGIFVGSRTMLEDLATFVERASIHPVIDREYSFQDAPEAFEYLASGQHFGKVVIRMDVN